MGKGRPAQGSAGPGVVAHAVIAVLGIAAMIHTAIPVESDGIIAFDTWATKFLTVTGLVTALVGGFLQGLAARVRLGGFAWFALLAFVPAALWPVGLVASGFRLVGTEDMATPSSLLGLAILAWLLTLAAEFGVARLVCWRGGSAWV